MKASSFRQKQYSHQSNLNLNIFKFPAPYICLIISLSISLISFDVRSLETYEEYRQEASKRLQAHVTKIQSQPETSLNNLDLAEAYFFIASITEPNKEKLKLHQLGAKLAEQILKSEPENDRALLWMVVNSLNWLKIKRPFSALWKLGNLEKKLLELRSRDQNIEYAAADRVLGIIYAESPTWIIGSKNKANKHFQDALRVAPEFPANKILYAEFLTNQGDLEKAQLLLQEVKSDNSLATYPLYEMLWRMDIHRILDKSN